MDSDSTSLYQDPFDLSEPSFPITGASQPSSQGDAAESCTYGELVNEIRKCGSRVLRYSDDYLKTRSQAPPEEAPQSEFVSKGDFLCAGRDFTVSAGHLFKATFDESRALGQKKARPCGDNKFVKPSSGTTAGAASSVQTTPVIHMTPVALKESVQSIHKSGNRPFVLGTFLREIRTMGTLDSCEFIVDLMGVAFVELGSEVKPTLVVELAIGNLVDFFKSSASAAVTWNMKHHLIANIGAALEALHQKAFVHADVKAQNVLVFPHSSTQFCAKLSDFGHCVASANVGLSTLPGTKNYLAPECLAGINTVPSVTPDRNGNSKSRDIYAFGLVIWEIATDCRKIPFSDVGLDDELVRLKCYNEVEAARWLVRDLPSQTPSYVKYNISAMLSTNPAHRPSIASVLEEIRNVMEEIQNPHLEDDHKINTNQMAFSSDRDCNVEEPDIPLLNIPWSLQQHLLEESLLPGSRGVDSKIFLAYCYILCSHKYSLYRREALYGLRRCAQTDPFRMAPGVEFTPFRAMMELRDWEGLSEVMSAIENDRSEDQVTRCLSHIYSFGWRKLVVLACQDAPDPAMGQSERKMLQNCVERMATAAVRLLARAGIENIGEARWGFRSDRRSAMHLAALTGKLSVVQALLESTGNADHSVRDDEDHTPLHVVCQDMSLSDTLSLEVTEVILRYQPHVVNEIVKGSLYAPLRFAIEAEKQLVARYLLEHGADVNACAAQGSTALQECAWIASEKGNGRMDEGCKNEDTALALATVLLTYGKVEVNMRSCHNSVTALGIAAAHGNSARMVSLLLDHGADPNTSVDDLTALGAAIQHRNYDMLFALLEGGADANYFVREVVPIGLAIGLDQHDTSQVLLTHGADVNILHQGVPLVSWAIYAHSKYSEHSSNDSVPNSSSDHEICPNLSLLIRHNAPVRVITKPHKNTEDIVGWSPIHFAAYVTSVPVLEAILDADPSLDLSIRTPEGSTALHITLTSGLDVSPDRTQEMIRRLARGGCDLNAVNDRGETALHLACKRHDAGLKDCLIDVGCDPSILHPSGWTAQHLFELDDKTISQEENARQKALKAKERRMRAKEIQNPIVRNSHASNHVFLNMDEVEERHPFRRYSCDHCSQIISGSRHKCLDCPDFDLCALCITGGE